MRIAIVGAGAVGATIAYSVMTEGLASRLVLADLDVERAEGQAMDLRHCASFVPHCDIESGGIGLVKAMDVIVLATAVRRLPGEPAGAHLRRNLEIFHEVAPTLAATNPKAVYVVVSTPVDLMSLYLIRRCGLPPGQVIGTGTLVDTSRLRQGLAARFGVDPHNVHAYVIGEHSHAPSRAVAVWSHAMVSACPVDDYAAQCGVAFGDAEKEAMFAQVVASGDEVVRRKGASFFGGAQAVVRILRAVIRDERSILTASVELNGFEGVWNLCQSVPVVVGRSGVVRNLTLKLAPAESERFKAAIEPMRALAAEIGL